MSAVAIMYMGMPVLATWGIVVPDKHNIIAMSSSYMY